MRQGSVVGSRSALARDRRGCAQRLELRGKDVPGEPSPSPSTSSTSPIRAARLGVLGRAGDAFAPVAVRRRPALAHGDDRPVRGHGALGELRLYARAPGAELAPVPAPVRMPVLAEPRSRLISSGRACRAVVAARAQSRELSDALLRRIRLAWFTSTLLLDEDDALASRRCPRVGSRRRAGDLADRRSGDRGGVQGRSRRDPQRRAAGPARDCQGRTAATDGPERFTAPSIVFRAADRRSSPAAGSRSATSDRPSRGRRGRGEALGPSSRPSALRHRGPAPLLGAARLGAVGLVGRLDPRIVDPVHLRAVEPGARARGRDRVVGRRAGAGQ